MTNKRLRHIQKNIESKFNRGHSKHWKNSDFVDLSHDIYLKTGEHISPGTLKRISGKVKTSHDYMPQPGVQKILNTYCGEEINPGRRSLFHHFSFAPIARHVILVVFVGILAGISGYFWLTKHQPPESEIPDNYRFWAKDTIGNAYHTVTFHYDFPLRYQNEMVLDPGDGSREKLNVSDSVFTHYYRKPGLYRGRLLYKGQTLKSFQVYLKTNGWELYSTKDYQENQEKRFYPIPIKNDGAFSVTTSQVQNSGIDTTELFYTHFCYFDSLDIADDRSVELSLDVRNDVEIIQARCNHVIITLQGSNESIVLYFLKPGCTHWSKVRVAENHYNGINHDLSAFGVDFSNWRNVSVVVNQNEKTKNKIEVSIDGIEIFNDQFESSLGKFSGIEVAFTGCGAFKNPVLNGNDVS